MIPRINLRAHLDMIPRDDPVKVEQRLTPDRLSSYMDVMGENLLQALNLYKWNIALSGAV